MSITSEDGRELPAKIVFGRSLEHFHKLALSEIGKRASAGCREEKVKWILTVPAIWGDKAKEFMKSAAEEVRILRKTTFIKDDNHELLYTGLENSILPCGELFNRGLGLYIGLEESMRNCDW